MEPQIFQAGDTVHHSPSDETWILAIDQWGDWVSPCGWPETIAEASHCQLVTQATPEQRRDMIQQWADKHGSDHRIAYARAQLKTLLS